MCALSFDLDQDPSLEDLGLLSEGLTQHNLEIAGERAITDAGRFAIFARNPQGEIVGGIYAHLRWDWLHVKMLWVRPDARGTGAGSRLLRQAEREALARRIEHSQLETTDFQALDFYQRHGYEVFAALEGKPKGHTWYYLKKELGL